NHLPIVIMVDAKEDNPAEKLPGMGLTNIRPFDQAAMNGIDQEIEAVFGGKSGHVITPDQVRGDCKTLNEAVLKGKFPTLKASRGKVLFVLLASAKNLGFYLNDHPSLAGRTMFVYSKAGNPETAFLNFNDPVGKEDEIRRLVSEGYIVRTRSDAETYEARSGDYTKMQAAFRSGAQIISTDYYQPDARHASQPGWSDFQVKIPGGALALVNPVNSGERGVGCRVGE
ncbi:MAG: Ca2+-dependent phosphoinositide-specific phospholipase C, partial [Bacteroidota bacterium]